MGSSFIKMPEVVPCPSPSRTYMSAPQIYYVTIKKVALGGAKGDVPFRVTIPAAWLIVASCATANIHDTLFLHFNPLGKVYTGNATEPYIGNEQWLPLCNAEGGKSKIGMGYRFCRPLPVNQDIYLDIGQESGGTDYFITLAYSDDVDDWKLVSQG